MTQSNALAIPPERDTTPSLMSESGIWAPPVPSSVELDDADVLDDDGDLDLGWDVEIPIDTASAPALPAPISAARQDVLAYDVNDEAPFELVAAPKSAPKPASKPAAMSVPPPDVRVPGPERTMLFTPSIRTRLWVSE